MKKSDVVIGIVPGEEETRFFVKNAHFEYLPMFVIEKYEMETPDGFLGKLRFSDLGYNEMLCMAKLFETVAEWIKPATPKKVKKSVPEVEGSTSTGWMSQTGNYFPTSGNMLHKEVAEQIWAENYPAHTASPETWATVQTDLMRLGWLRFDYGDVEFMRRPTEMQREAIEQMLEWKLRNPSAWTSFDLAAYEKMQRMCQWLSGNVTDDFADLEEEIEK